MKVSDLQQQLDEGFLDNFVNRVKAMAGGDGPTGIIRALQGNNAALNKFADALVNVARPQIMRRMGNSAEALRSGTGRMPIGMIYKTTLGLLPRVAANDNIEVEPATVKQLLRDNKADLLRLVLRGDVADDDVVRRTYDAVLTGAPEADLGNDIDATTKVVALIIAAGVMLAETSQQDIEFDNAELDEQAVSDYQTVAMRVTRALTSPDSPLVKAVKPDQTYKDNVQEFIVSFVARINSKYKNLNADDMAAAAATPPKIFASAQDASRAITGHIGDRSTLTPDMANFATQINDLIQNTFAAWLKVADSDKAPGRPRAYKLVTLWAADLLNNHLAKLDATKSAPETEAKPASTDEPEKTFNDAEEAGRAAMRALTKNPGESDRDFDNRQFAEYERARSEYLRAHPLP